MRNNLDQTVDEEKYERKCDNCGELIHDSLRTPGYYDHDVHAFCSRACEHTYLLDSGVLILDEDDDI